MEEKKSKISNGSYFEDRTVAHIDAYYKEGNFYDFRTGELVKLDYDERLHKKGILTKIVVPLSYISEDNLEIHGNRVQKKILDKGSILTFSMYYNSEREHYKFQMRLEDDLFLNKVGNKPAKLNPCRCIVTKSESGSYFNFCKDFEPIESKSLNQAFLQTSIKHRPKNTSHVCNVFTTFKTENEKLLDLFRQ